jgi:hypothetical protein
MYVDPDVPEGVDPVVGVPAALVVPVDVEPVRDEPLPEVSMCALVSMNRALELEPVALPVVPVVPVEPLVGLAGCRQPVTVIVFCWLDWLRV